MIGSPAVLWFYITAHAALHHAVLWRTLQRQVLISSHGYPMVQLLGSDSSNGSGDAGSGAEGAVSAGNNGEGTHGGEGGGGANGTVAAAVGGPRLEPLPDYWVAVLHKRLLGTKVLSAAATASTPFSTSPITTAAGTGGDDADHDGGDDDGEAELSGGKAGRSPIRVYAHCAASAAGAPEGAVSVAWLNIGGAAADLDFAALGGGRREDWVLTAGAPLPAAKNPLQSKQVKLNGNLLPNPLLHSHGERAVVPPLPGLAASAGQPLRAPGRSYGFSVLLDAKLPACVGHMSSGPAELPTGH